MFTDRHDAGLQLYERLPPLDPEQTVVLALPRGGVPVAEEIARRLGAPLDVVFVRKVGVPSQPELALAAVTDGDDPALTVNEEIARHTGLSEERIWELAQPQLDEIARRKKLYLGGRPPVDIAGKTVIVVDDGIATGATMRASLRLLRARKPAKIILAVPVAPADTLESLEADADEVICLEIPRPFHAVGAHYRDFAQVPDAAVAEALARNAARREDAGDG